MKEEKSEKGRFTLLFNDKSNVYQLKLHSEGATETLWMDEAELVELKQFLNERGINHQNA